MVSQAVRIKTFEVLSYRKELDNQVNQWLEDNKEIVEVMNISTSSRITATVVYMATVVYKGDI